MTRFIIPLAIALALSGCSHFSAVHESDAKSDTKKEEGKRYPMQGDIKIGRASCRERV